MLLEFIQSVVKGIGWTLGVMIVIRLWLEIAALIDYIKEKLGI